MKISRRPISLLRLSLAGLLSGCTSLFIPTPLHPEVIAGLDSPLVNLSRVDPKIPARLPDELRRGDVLVRYVVNEVGQTQEIEIVTATNSILGEISVRAVSQYRFAPPLKDGKPTTASTRQLFRYFPN